MNEGEHAAADHHARNSLGSADDDVAELYRTGHGQQR